VESPLRFSHAIDNVDVDVDVDLVVDTAGHPLATDVSPYDLGRARGMSGSSCVPIVGRVHDHVHDHEHFATCPPETFTASQMVFLDNRRRKR
jgi:hypothetical protein